ncbi:ribbon-helix-helix domain-containing protein [Candidatus Fermentibacterales bacterium]|nr:ribbon-helix-helix domain-containing protein [Candidatus Fermentibacterales bacterium]
MIRTQVYLTERERQALRELSRSTGKPMSQLIREAIDSVVRRTGHSGRREVLRSLAGIWRDRDDLPYFREVREEWERGLGR